LILCVARYSVAGIEFMSFCFVTRAVRNVHKHSWGQNSSLFTIKTISNALWRVTACMFSRLYRRVHKSDVRSFAFFSIRRSWPYRLVFTHC